MSWAGTPEPGDDPPAPLRPARLILLDDDADVRASIGDVLGAAGHLVAAYASGEDVLADADRHAGAAVLIADVMLSGPLDGIAVAEALKARIDGLKVLYITGYFAADRMSGMRPQDRFLRKPFGVAELLNAVRELI
jgi:FixJ family two-component response regulator